MHSDLEHATCGRLLDELPFLIGNLAWWSCMGCCLGFQLRYPTTRTLSIPPRTTPTLTESSGFGAGSDRTLSITISGTPLPLCWEDIYIHFQRSGGASRPRTAADWQSVCRPSANGPTAGMCRISYLEAFSIPSALERAASVRLRVFQLPRRPRAVFASIYHPLSAHHAAMAISESSQVNATENRSSFVPGRESQGKPGAHESRME